MCLYFVLFYYCFILLWAKNKSMIVLVCSGHDQRPHEFIWSKLMKERSFYQWCKPYHKPQDQDHCKTKTCWHNLCIITPKIITCCECNRISGNFSNTHKAQIHQLLCDAGVLPKWYFPFQSFQYRHYTWL